MALYSRTWRIAAGADVAHPYTRQPYATRPWDQPVVTESLFVIAREPDEPPPPPVYSGDFFFLF